MRSLHSGWWELNQLAALCELWKVFSLHFLLNVLYPDSCSLHSLVDFHPMPEQICIHPKTQRVPCDDFFDFLLCVASSSPGHSFENFSTSQNFDLCLLNTEALGFYLNSFFFCTVWNCIQVGRWSNQRAPFIYFPLSVITVLHCQLFHVWKQLFHVFCALFQLFMVKGQVLEQLSYHMQKQNSVDKFVLLLNFF